MKKMFLNYLFVFACFLLLLSSFYGGKTQATDGVLGTANSYTSKEDAKTKDINMFGTKDRQEDSFVNVVKGGVNRVLGILALIALIYLMRGGFQMVTSGGDEDKYSAGFTILKHGATGLILIGVAWFVISIVFWLVAQIANDGTGPAETQI